MSGTPRSDAFIEEIRAEFPRFSIVDKTDDALSRAIDLGLKIVTLWGQRQYLTHYHTVLGDTLYVPSRWDETPDLARLVTLRHERVHLRQRRRLGTVPMALCYAVLFLPIGLAYGRARIEWEAYAETIRATAEVFGQDAARSPELRAHVVRQFTSAAYGWMWPFPRTVERWYDAALATLAALGQNDSAPGTSS
jgi:hypothetical protein